MEVKFISYYSQIPNCLFYACGGINKSILKSVCEDNNKLYDKVLLILDYLYTKTDRKGISSFELEHLIKESLYTAKAGVSGTTQQFKNILLKLDELNIIEIYDKEPINGTYVLSNHKYYECIFKINIHERYFQLDHENKDKILNYNSEDNGIDNKKLLLFYCYLLSRLYKRRDITDTKNQECHPSYEIISKDIGLSEGVIKKYIDVLVELNLIRFTR